MKTRHFITGAMSMIAMLGLGVQPSLADQEYGSTHAPAVLTPEQREKAKASHEKRMQEMRSSPQGPTPRGSR